MAFPSTGSSLCIVPSVCNPVELCCSISTPCHGSTQRGHSESFTCRPLGSFMSVLERRPFLGPSFGNSSYWSPGALQVGPYFKALSGDSCNSLSRSCFESHWRSSSRSLRVRKSVALSGASSLLEFPMSDVPAWQDSGASMHPLAESGLQLGAICDQSLASVPPCSGLLIVGLEVLQLVRNQSDFGGPLPGQKPLRPTKPS